MICIATVRGRLYFNIGNVLIIPRLLVISKIESFSLTWAKVRGRRIVRLTIVYPKSTRFPNGHRQVFEGREVWVHRIMRRAA